ncbi:hypothetical protein GCM10017566_36240 [Amycolatopsis bartoniae]|uniref:Uncharacterized protein n=1 Tax=Amycolatopsis bartoniae TaxID=941986 RepID=A0A8H9MAR6_9PSEU|nr:hypothetical protein GCM10017566_36240 [Amycolatopsis bartoniae]
MLHGTLGFAAGWVVFLGVDVGFFVVVVDFDVLGGAVVVVVDGGGAVVVVVVGAGVLVDVGVPAAARGCTAVVVPPEHATSAAAAAVPVTASQILFTRTWVPLGLAVPVTE